MKFKMSKIVVAAAFAVIAAGVSAETSEVEKQCIQNGLDRAEAIEKDADSFLNGYMKLLPDLKEAAQRDLADPYRCSRVIPADGK